MLSFLMVVCVGLSGDDWTYSKFESEPTHGVAKSAARPAQASIPAAFTERSMAKFVEHSPAVPSPAPQPQPDAKVQPTVHVTVKPQPPKKGIAKEACSRCGTACGCGDVCLCEVCQCDATSHIRGGKNQWWTLPEDPTLEGYGEVVLRDGEPVLKYTRLRPKRVARQPPETTIRAVAPTVYYRPQTFQMPTQTPMAYCVRGKG